MKTCSYSVTNLDFGEILKCWHQKILVKNQVGFYDILVILSLKDSTVNIIEVPPIGAISAAPGKNVFQI